MSSRWNVKLAVTGKPEKDATMFRDDSRDPRLLRRDSSSPKSLGDSKTGPNTQVTENNSKENVNPQKSSTLQRQSSKQSGLKQLQDDQSRPFRRVISSNSLPPVAFPPQPITNPITAVSVPHLESASLSAPLETTRILDFADNLEDPIICNMPLDGTGRICTERIPGSDRKRFWEKHLKFLHKNLGSGSMSTVHGKGVFTPSPTGASNIDALSKPAPTFSVTVNNSSPIGGLGKPSLKRQRTVSTETSQTTTEEQIPNIQTQSSPVVAPPQKNDFTAMLNMINFLKQNNTLPPPRLDISPIRSDNSPIPPPASPITPSITPRPEHSNPSTVDGTEALSGSVSASGATDELSPDQKRIILEWREREVTVEEMQALLKTLRKETVPLFSITHFLETSSNLLPTQESASTNTSIPQQSPSRSSSTSAVNPSIQTTVETVDKTKIKIESTSLESSPAPPALHPFIASLQDLPIHGRIEELRKLYQILPAYIEAEELSLQQQEAERLEKERQEQEEKERKEKEELARQRKEKQEQIERLQRELEELSRQEEERSLARTTSIISPAAEIQPPTEPSPSYENPVLVQDEKTSQIPKDESQKQPIHFESLSARITDTPERMDDAPEGEKHSLNDEVGEHVNEVKPDSPSTHDSYNQGLSSVSPPPFFQQPAPKRYREELKPSLARRVTFAKEESSRRNLPLERRISLSSESPQSQYTYSPASPPINFLFPPAHPNKRPREGESPFLLQMPPKRPRAEELRSVIHYQQLSAPASVLLTNTHDNWSEYCVCLEYDGNIDLLSNRTHALVPHALVFNHQYTCVSAINGAWIAPGSLALVHRDARKEEYATQISLINYYEPHSSRKPRVIRMRDTPHGQDTKITAISALWHNNSNKAFVTADLVGEIYLWNVNDRDGGMEGFARVDTMHRNHFRKSGGVSALAYIPEKDWLLSAGGRPSTMFTYDLFRGEEASQRNIAQVKDKILQIECRPGDLNVTALTIRNRVEPLALVDHRSPKAKGSIVREFCYPERSIANGGMIPWNLSGCWDLHDPNYFALGGTGDVHIWDIRGPRSPVSSRDLGLGYDEAILSTRLVDDQILGMTDKKLAWAKLG